jgi:hypothetical protein
MAGERKDGEDVTIFCSQAGYKVGALFRHKFARSKIAKSGDGVAAKLVKFLNSRRRLRGKITNNL